MCVCLGLLLPLPGHRLHRTQLPPEISWSDHWPGHTCWSQTCVEQAVRPVWAVEPQQPHGHTLPGCAPSSTHCTHPSRHHIVLIFLTFVTAQVGTWVEGSRQSWSKWPFSPSAPRYRNILLYYFIVCMVIWDWVFVSFSICICKVIAAVDSAPLPDIKLLCLSPPVEGGCCIIGGCLCTFWFHPQLAHRQRWWTGKDTRTHTHTHIEPNYTSGVKVVVKELSCQDIWRALNGELVPPLFIRSETLFPWFHFVLSMQCLWLDEPIEARVQRENMTFHISWQYALFSRVVSF